MVTFASILQSSRYNPIAVVDRNQFTGQRSIKRESVIKLEYGGKTYILKGDLNKSGDLEKVRSNIHGEVYTKHRETRKSSSRYDFKYNANSRSVYIFPNDRFFKSGISREFSEESIDYLRKVDPSFGDPTAPTVDELA